MKQISTEKRREIVAALRAMGDHVKVCDECRAVSMGDPMLQEVARWQQQLPVDTPLPIGVPAYCEVGARLRAALPHRIRFRTPSEMQ